MRAKEFITESQDWRSNYDRVVEYDGILMGINVLPWEVEVCALTRDGKEMGGVDFDRDGKTLVPGGLLVQPAWRGQGIAKTMYDFTKDQGYKIIASSDQTDDGRAFWKKNRGKETVWEDEVDEMALPANWDPTALGHDKTFKSRLEYAKDRAQRLGGGSSRVAFVIPDQGRETVLKIAKNKKGMAQNEAEVDILEDGYLGKMDIVIPLIDYDRTNPTPVWIQTEKANKVNRKRLEQLLYCDELDYGIQDFMSTVYNVMGKRQSWMPTMKQIKQDLEDTTMSQEEIDTFFEYVNEVAMLVSSSSLLPDDLYNIGNWGEYNGRPVIIDLGFTESVKPLYQR